MRFSVDKIRQKLERWTRTDLKYLSTGSFWLILSQIINILSGLASSTLFARLVAPEQYGTYRYLLSIYGFLVIFTLPGIRTAMTRSISQGQGQALFFGIKTQIKAALFGSMIALGISGWYALHQNMLLASGLGLIAIFLPFTDTLDISSFFQGKRAFRSLFFYTSSITLTTLAAALLGMALGGKPLILLGLFLGGIAFVRGCILIYIRRYASSKDPIANLSQKKDIAAFGAQLSLLSVISVAANSLDKILLFHYLNPTVVANYTFATALPNQLRGLVRNLGTLALPKFSNRPEQEVYQGLLKRLPLLIGGVGVFVGCYLLAAPFIFRLLFPTYLSALPVSQLFCLSIFDSITYPISSAFAAHKKTKILASFTLTIYIVDLGLLFLLTPFMGIQGVVIAKVTSRLLNALLGSGIVYFLAKKQKNTSLSGA